MRKIEFYICGSLALGALFGGCTLPEPSSNNQSPPPVVVSPVTTPQPIVTPVPQIVANPGLIQSTNPNERLKQLKVANKDPFAANQPTALIITTPPDERSRGSGNSGNSQTSNEGENSSGLADVLGDPNEDTDSKKTKGRVVRASKSGNNSQSSDKGKNTSNKASKTDSNQKSAQGGKKTNSKTAKSGSSQAGSGNKDKKPGNGGKTNTNNNPQPSPGNRPPVPNLPDENPNTPPIASPGMPPGGTPGEPSIPDTPPAPQLASQIEVRGVVQLDNGYSYAIVRGPNEKSSSNLAQGDLVPNTGITIKRIEVDRSEGKMSGMVVLEENGVEITRPVGEKVAGAEGESENTPGNNFPNPEASPPDHSDGNSGGQQFTPPPQPVPNQNPPGVPTPPGIPNQPGVPTPPGNIDPNANPNNITPTPPTNITPTPIQSQSPDSGFPTPEGTPPLDR
jgi:hypothetical protein